MFGTISYLNHQLVGATSIRNEVRLDQRSKLKPLPFLVHFPRQGLSDGAHLGAMHHFQVRPSWKAEYTVLPSVELEYGDSLGYNIISDGLLQWCSSIPLFFSMRAARSDHRYHETYQSMNCFEVLQLCGIFRPKFDEQRNAENKITATGCQYEGCVPTMKTARFTSLLQRTPRRRDLGLGGLAGRLA